MELIRPSVEYRDSYLASFDESDPMPRQMGFDVALAKEDFPRFVRELCERAEGKHMPEGYVPDSVFWLVDNGEYIGRISVRHFLSDHLKEIGGHIGYDIRPSKRNQGYGSKILALALPKARALGITDVLVTCDATNVGSRKIIEKNGGVLEDQVPNPAGGPDKLRFWIHL